ncbi:unnamed protein product [Mycetohabitans rhizoxinica HKI 454]|uniref:Uncharacterized protein n=1 Tax=Mycetohabitans rhizoxinica (strain DSM 19002 / CIP 109453 / HKI 454) TaxID=882378 RepID=E5AQA2_MYCRK|nr:unnamed protein product [Mycetohabitans rhizoxinica HKI 454]
MQDIPVLSVQHAGTRLIAACRTESKDVNNVALKRT